VRNSLALRVIDQLHKEGAIVQAHDPVAIPAAQGLREHGPEMVYCDDPYEAVRHAEALLILTDWPSFSGLDYSHIKSKMAFPCIVDARNLLDAEAMESLGYTYVGIGRR